MAYKSEMGIEDLDQLIHSYEYENQNFVKMIEQEKQLMKALESEIDKSSADTKRMETEITHFEEESERLLKQCNINKLNIESQKKTKGLMCDHEAALSKKLESCKLETAEKKKFFEENIAKYSAIRDDHMIKYKSFPLAIELENWKREVLSAQELVNQAESKKSALKQMIAAKEDELDSRVLSRIIVRIAKAKLTTFQLEKEIQECLNKKDVLQKQLEEVSQSKKSMQTNDCVQQYNEEIPMETSEESFVLKTFTATQQISENKSAHNESQETFALDSTNDQDMLDEQSENCILISENVSYADQSYGRRHQGFMPSEINKQTTQQYRNYGFLNSTVLQRDEYTKSVNSMSSFTTCRDDQLLKESEASIGAVFSEKKVASTHPTKISTPTLSPAEYSRLNQQPLLRSQMIQATTSSNNVDESYTKNSAKPPSALLTQTSVSRLPVPCFGKSSLFKNQEKQDNLDMKKVITPSFFPKFNLPRVTHLPRQPSPPLPRQTSAPLPRQPSAPLPRQPSAPLPRQASTPLPRQASTPLPRQPSTPLPRQPSTPLPRQPSAPLPRQTSAPLPRQPSDPPPRQPRWEEGQMTYSYVDQPKAQNLPLEIGQHKTTSAGLVQKKQSFQSFLPRFPSIPSTQTSTTASSATKATPPSSSTLMPNTGNSKSFQIKGLQPQPSVRLAPSMSLTHDVGDCTRTKSSVLYKEQDKANGEQLKQHLGNNVNSRNVREEPSESFRMYLSNMSVSEGNKMNSFGDSVLQEQSNQEKEPLFKLNIDINSDQTKPLATGLNNSQSSSKRNSQSSQHFDLGSYFTNFGSNDSDDEDRPALYNLFGFSGKSKDSSKDEENESSAVFALGSFMQNDSDSSEVEPATFLNFCSGKNTESSEHTAQGFTLNFSMDNQNADEVSNDGTDNDRPKFKLFDQGIDF